MEFQTAKKAIDYFFNLIRNNKGKTKNNYISIGFYGGEAALEFSLIRDIVKCIKEKMLIMGMSDIFKPRFRLSTNGYKLR
jgi:sulfatase maturation enzyme AslB (radical SAM superfamily)